MPSPLPSALVISLDPTLHTTLQRVLTSGGLHMRPAAPDPTLPARCELDPPALVMLDLHRLGAAGVDLCRQIRARIACPILVLGAPTDREVLLAALDAGADDHVGLPMHPDDVLLRVGAALRRGPAPPQRADSRLRCGPLEIDRQTMQVWRHGQTVRLTAKERDLLALLLAHPGQILTQQQVLERIWGPAYAEMTNLLHTHISNLRRKIEADPAQPRYLLTERGIGYRFVLPPTAAGHAPGNSRAGAPAASTMRYQLRPPIRDFVGRAAEVQQLRAALLAASQPRELVAIGGVQGMGGIGKTELAYMVAHQLCDAFPDGQIVLDLRGSSAVPLRPEQALQQVIRAFTASDALLPDDLLTLEARYRSVLHDQRVLLLADDARDAAQVRPLLPPAGCALLVTSRVRFTLPGMVTLALEQLAEDAAISLLRAICPRLDADDGQVIARMCGYLPLALRVSGSILHNDPALSLPAYIQRLTDAQQRLAQLRDPDDGQLDVAASLALSYTQLDAPAQQVFRQLGAFVADFSTELALAVVESAEGTDVEGLLRVLLRRNLVQYEAGRSRWRLHDLVQDLARRYLGAAGELEMASWRYARAAVQLAQDIQTQFLAGRDPQLAALIQFDAERPHIDVARRWASAHTGTPEGDTLLLADARATTDIGPLRYHIQHEIIPQLETALSAAQNLGDRNGEAQILTRLGTAYEGVGEIQRAIPYCEQARAIAHATADQYTEALALNFLGINYWRLGAIQQSFPYYEQALRIARVIGDRRMEARALTNLGVNYWGLGAIQRAIAHYEQALRITQAIGSQLGESIVLTNLGLAFGALGDAGRALAYHTQALAIARAIGDRHGEGTKLSELGQTYLAVGDTERAIATCAQALEIIREARDRREEGDILSTLGRAYATRGDRAWASSAFEQALALFRVLGDRRGEAQCGWHFGLALAGWGEYTRALPLLRTALAYEQAIEHAKAAEHSALVEQLETEGELPAAPRPPADQRTVGVDADAPCMIRDA